MNNYGLQETKINEFSFTSHSLHIRMRLCADDIGQGKMNEMRRFSMEIHGKNKIMEIDLKIHERIPTKSVAAVYSAIDDWRNGKLEHEFDVCGWGQLAYILYDGEGRELHFAVYLDAQGDGLDNQLQIRVPSREIESLMNFLKKADEVP